jgi:hypothetical protein
MCRSAPHRRRPMTNFLLILLLISHALGATPPPPASQRESGRRVSRALWSTSQRAHGRCFEAALLSTG